VSSRRPKQAELADVASRLAKFNPTEIAVEALSDRTDFVTNKFDGFTAEKLSKDRTNALRSAFRLAHQLGQKSVYGIDEQATRLIISIRQSRCLRQGAPAKRRARPDAGEGCRNDQQMEAAQKTKPVRLMLADVNDPARILSDHQNFYYALLSLGNEKEQPGAELNAVVSAQRANLSQVTSE